MNPDNAYGYNARGQTYLNLRKYAEARADFTKTITVSKSAGDQEGESLGYVGLASVDYSLEHYDQVLVSLDQALTLTPANQYALKFKADVLSEIGDYKAATEVIDKVLKNDPKDGDAFAIKGWALENLGINNAQDALEAYMKAIELDKDNLWFHKGVGNALRLLRDTGAANAKYQWVIERAEARSINQPSLVGWCYYCIGQFKDAISNFKEALKLNPGELSTQFDLALTYACNRQYREALEEYERGLEALDRKHILKQRGLLYVAVDDVKEAIIRQPDLATVAEVQEIQRQLQEAIVAASEMPAIMVLSGNTVSGS